MGKEMYDRTRKLVTMSYALNVVCWQGVEEIQDPVTYYLLQYLQNTFWGTYVQIKKMGDT